MKIALLFPGYGSQSVGMGKDLYDEYRIVQEYFEEASNCLNNNFVKLCFASSDVELSKMVNAYTSLFLVSSACYALLKQEGITCDVVAGYNNGESAALFAAGCFSFPDGLYLLNKFCLLYQEMVETISVGVMHVQGIETDQLRYLCSSICDQVKKKYAVTIGIYNSETDHIVTGMIDELEIMRDMVVGRVGVSVGHLAVEVGLHSPLVQHVTDQFKQYLEKVDFKDVSIPFLSSVDGTFITQGAVMREHFIQHFHAPLMFNRVLSQLHVYDIIIVATPGDHLMHMLRTQYPDKKIYAIMKSSDIEILKTTLTHA